MMNTPQRTNATIDAELEQAVRDWTPRNAAGSAPAVEMEPQADGLRVRLTYLGVETGVVFARGVTVTKPAVEGTLDRLFEVLSWRVVSPRA